MSEYQYYEFQKLDDRLNEKELGELRSYSTRARITPTSFINEYDYGNFKGDADIWMEKYFDGFLYLANWGSRELQLALPAKLLPVETARQYSSNHSASSREKSGKLIVKFISDEEPDEEWLEGAGYLAPLLQIRNELAQGDLRSLYLGWLIGVQAGELKASAKEPPVPPNLDTLSGPQASFVDFFCLDPDLLSVAALNSPHAKTNASSEKELTAWIELLPAREKDKMLVQLLQGDASKIGLELQSRFQRHRGASEPKIKVNRRTVAELLTAAKLS